jgi:hypothetical protein
LSDVVAGATIGVLATRLIAARLLRPRDAAVPAAAQDAAPSAPGV